jgi:hypothetical protein
MRAGESTRGDSCERLKRRRLDLGLLKREAARSLGQG